MDFSLEERPWDYYIDQLTGLYNRYALEDFIKHFDAFSIFVLDVDNFNNMNNIYGMENADKLLIELSKNLSMLKPIDAELFRVGSDGFVILIAKTMSRKQLLEFGQSILSFFEHLDIEISPEINTKISFTIGIDSGSSLETLLHANLAIEDARRFQKNTCKLYDPESEYVKKSKETIYWIDTIRRAVEEEKIVSFFQPILNNKTGKIEKYECLVRIEDKGSLYVSPYQFMEACRLTKTYELITRNMIALAFKTFANTSYSFSINITSSDINLDYLEKFLLSKCERYNIKPSQIILELLEDIVTLTEKGILEQLNSLREKGFKIALDDFGTESSNFARLLDLKPDFLKIDGVFIKDINTNEKSQIIVETIVEFCKKTGIEVIAEFVSSKEILETIQKLGIEYSQGFYIGEPKKELIAS